MKTKLEDEIHMFSYWCNDKYGPTYALQHYGQELLKEHPILLTAMNNIMINEQFIKDYVKDLADKQVDNDF